MSATELERLRAELATSQALEKVLRDVLEWYSKNAFNGYGDSVMGAARAILATPADDTALRAALAQRERETIERCANFVEGKFDFCGDELEIAEAIRALEVRP